MKLYEITEQYRELLALADDQDMAQAVSDTLEAVADDFNKKAEMVSNVVLNFQSDIASIDSEIKRLQQRKTQIKNKEDSLKEYLRMNMERTGISKISCPLFSITCAKGREVAVVDQADELPDDYVSVKTSIEPDKKKITDDLKAGVDIPGARLERTKSSIRIK